MRYHIGMNPLRKAYCRIFQTVFRLAIPLLPYRKPEILPGLDRVPQVLKAKNAGSVLIITDKSIRRLGLLDGLEETLGKAGISFTVYDGTVANPTTDNVEEAFALYKEKGCQALIGFGGGSSMDAAKAVGARAANPRKPLSKMKGILRVRRRLPPLIAVPTTAGTGSETTLAAVIVDSATRHKYVINDFPLIPHYAVLDPSVTLSLPASVTASTGMDALTHAVEAYIGRSTTKETRAEALEAVSLIFSNLPQACRNGKDSEARRNMLKAAYLAGAAFTKSYVGYVHAVAHSLGGEYNVPHGLANAVLLPFVLEEYGSVCDAKLKKLAIAAGAAQEDTPEDTAAKAFIKSIKQMKEELGIPDTIPELKEEDIPKLAAYADSEGNPLYPVPVLMDKKELEKLYRRVLEVKG